MRARTSAWASIAARALLALCAWGCASPLTEIVLAVDAQDADITQVRILVTSPSGATSLDESQAVTAASFPLTLSLTRSSAPYEPVVIEVRAERPSGRITRRVRTGFVEGERRLLRVALSSACTGMACDATTTCITASCVSDVVPAASLPPFTGSVPGSDAGTGDPRDAGPVDAWMPDAGPPSPCSPLCAPDRTCFAGLCLDTDAPLAPAAIAIGESHVCVVHEGIVYCRGDNASQQLGAAGGESSEVFVRVPGLTEVTAVTVGRAHSCAIARGSVACWGDNARGQLGRGFVGMPQGMPMAVFTVLGSRPLAAGRDHTCVIDDGQRVWCWGDNAAGQLGLGDEVPRSTPSRVGMVPADGLSVGDDFTCVLRGATVVCWGRGDAGQMGDGDTMSRSAPGATAMVGAASAIAAGAAHACALLTDGTLACWGDGRRGQLGNGMMPATAPVPEAVLDVGVVSRVVLGGQHSLALRDDGALFGWGDDAAEQLGIDGDFSAMPVAAGEGVVGVWAGSFGTVIWDASGPRFLGRP